jgi:hypothetical protein
MKMNRCFQGWLFGVLFAGAVQLAGAAAYTIDWYTFSGGGGVSTGGPYSLYGVIGQPAVATSTGGSYQVSGGFLSMVGLVQAPDRPTLRVVFTTTNTVVIAWPVAASDFKLQESVELGSTAWAPAPAAATVGQEKQVIVAPPVGRKFYRLEYP